MNRFDALSPVEILTLVRLIPAGEKGETRANLVKDLKPLVEHRWEGAAWTERLDSALDALESTGVIARRKPGKAAARFRLTDEGHRRALAAIGLEELPPKTTWAKLKSPYLLALALGCPGPGEADAKWLATAPGLKAEVLRKRFGLDLDPRPTLKQATDATAGKLLGLAPGRPFNAEEILKTLLRDAGVEIPSGQKATPTNIQAALFRRELGEAGARKPVDRLVAQSLGARQSSPAELAAAALRSWVERSDGASPTGSTTPAAPSAIDLAEFARRVIEAARASRSGWFGDAKVFIVHVWRALRDDPAFSGTDADAFKARLIAAHRARLIELGRADLVEAMDPADVRESATPYLNAVYHFVRTEDQGR